MTGREDRDMISSCPETVFQVLDHAISISNGHISLFPQPEDLQRHRHPLGLIRVLGDLDRHSTRNVETGTGAANGTGTVSRCLPLVVDCHAAYCTTTLPTRQGVCFG